MSEQRIDIQKELGSHRGLFGMGGGQSSPEPTESDTPPPPPVAGFWLRALAFVIDGIALFFLATLWRPAMLEFFLAHPLWLYPVHILINLAYFTILAGPVGGGRSLGKRILGIEIRSLTDGPLSGKQALTRTLIQWAPVILFMTADNLLSAHAPQSPGQPTAFWITMLITIPGMGLFVANAAAVALRPDKRGLHDLLTQTYVEKKNSEQTISDYLADLPPTAFSRANTAVAVLALVISTLLAYQNVSAERFRAPHRQFIQAFWEENALDGFTVFLADPVQMEYYIQSQINAPVPALNNEPAAETHPATDTITLPYHMYYVRTGAVDTAELAKTIEEDNLSTRAAQYILDHKEQAYLADFESALRDLSEKSGRSINIAPIETFYIETLPQTLILRLMGPFHSKEIRKDRIDKPLFVIQRPPHTEPYPEQLQSPRSSE